MSVTVANTTASLSGKTLAKLEDSQTFTGQKTFDLGASAPFVVVSGAAKVDNLDADKLDGQTGSYYNDAANLTGLVPTASLSNAFGLDTVCGRLTLTTALPVTTADVTAATTLYYALYRGNRIALYTGSAWRLFTIAQLSIAVPATTAQMYDVFVDYNAGTPALSLTAWTNDTTRATALTLQDGVLVLTGSTGKRFVGCMRTTGVSGQTEDSLTKRFVANYYYPKPRPLRKTYPDASWNYTTATWRQANANTANQVEWIVPVAEAPLRITLNGSAGNGTAVNLNIGIGVDSTSAPVSGQTGGFGQTTAITNTPFTPAVYDGFAAAGYHYAAGLEYSPASGTTTWYGSASPGVVCPSGLSGSVEG